MSVCENKLFNFLSYVVDFVVNKSCFLINFCLLFHLKIVFEGVRGISYLGDIAVDDVSLSGGSCNQGDTLLKFLLFILKVEQVAISYLPCH